MKAAQSCRACVHFGAPGEERFRKGSVYQCRAPLPELPPLPESVTGHWTFAKAWPPSRAFVEPGDGTSCPTFERRPKI